MIRPKSLLAQQAGLPWSNCVLLLWTLSSILGAESGTVSNAVGGAGAAGDFLPILGDIVDVIRSKEDSLDSITINNEMSEFIDYQCNFLNGGERSTIGAGASIQRNISRKYTDTNPLYCKLFRNSTGVILPQVKHGEKCCKHSIVHIRHSVLMYIAECFHFYSFLFTYYIFI